MYYEPHNIEIKYLRGRMIIYAHEFFPASKQRLRKLLKVVSIADDPEQIKADMFKYVREQFEYLKGAAVDLVMRHQESIESARKAESAVTHQDGKVKEVAEYVRRVDKKLIYESKATAKRIKEELKTERKLLRELKKKASELRGERNRFASEIKVAERHLKLFMENMEVLNG